jgi:signal transduction histidine kinase
MNLVLNARDAMRDGGVVTVEVSSRAVTTPIAVGVTGQRIPPGEWAVLAVCDHGTGMSRETAARVFEPLFTTKAVGTGTGLGLWTVHAVVTQAGGYVTVDSAPGRGSTFRIWLPAVSAPVPGDPSGSPADLALGVIDGR